MNKTKVMQILNSIDLGLNITEEGQQLDTQALIESVRTDVEDLKEELNSKPVMPKVFDEWHEEELELCSCCEDEIDDLIDLNTELYMPDRDSNSAHQLFEWINQIDQDDIKSNSGRFIKCIDAIRYGYEVEK